MNFLPSAAACVVLVPVVGALVLALVPGWVLASRLNLLFSVLTFALACRLPFGPADGDWLMADPLAVVLALLTSFTGLTTAWFSLGYVAHEAGAGKLGAGSLRVYHAAFQAMSGFLLAALLSDNIGLTWVAIEAATIAGVLVVGLPQTAEAIEASWKFFILCGVAVALALFGTIMLYLASVPVTGPGWAAMRWSALAVSGARDNGAVLNLAFVFLLIGYGTKAGLVPLHGWLADAHAEGPTPVSAILSGAVLNVALSVLLRLRGVMDANAAAGMGAIAPGPVLMGLGLASLLVAAFGLWQRRDVKRFFAFSTIEQNGIAALALGLGGPLATFAGLLHMILQTLSKASVFQCVGRAAQLRGSQRIDQLAGLLAGSRGLGLTLAVATVGLAGLPPMGLFSSEFLVVRQTILQAPWLAPPLALGLMVGAWALISRIQILCLGTPTLAPGAGTLPAPDWRALLPAWLPLIVVVLLGLAMPDVVLVWLQAAAAQR
jgi:hydrogenase-4 component F